MKPAPSKSPYYRRAERCVFELGGWHYVANKFGMTAEAAQRTLGNTRGDNAKIAADLCLRIERLAGRRYG